MSKLHSLLPKSLIARFALIICVPMVLCQIFAVYIFYKRHWSNVTLHNAKVLSSQIELIDEEYKLGDLTKVVKYTNLFRFSFSNAGELPKASRSKFRSEVLILRNILRDNLDNFVAISHDQDNSEISIFLYDSDNKFLKITIPQKPLINPTSEIFVYWIIGISILFMLIALIFSKNQIRSIEELSHAANKFGYGGVEKFSFKPTGALEIRNAGYAFIRMQDRLEKQVKKRLQMLAMISHDLRTPLTRLLLQIELSDDTEDNIAIKNDLVSMKHMIDSYLDFARGEKAEEFQKIELGEWIKDNIESTKPESTNIIISDENIYLNIRPIAFNRALSNIISNADKYSTKSELSYKKRNDCLEIIVEDNGKGIQEDEKKLVFKAFYRSEKGRTVDKYGSVGLGLPIAKEIIKSHRGTIEIDNSSKLGGAKFIIKIPLIKEEK